MSPPSASDPFLELCSLLTALADEAADPLAPAVVQARSDVYRFLVAEGWVPPERVRALLHLDEQLTALDLETWPPDLLPLMVVQPDPARREQVRTRIEGSQRLRLVGLAADAQEAVLVAAYAQPHLVLVDAELPDCVELVETMARSGAGAAVMPFPLPWALDAEIGPLAVAAPTALPDLPTADPEAARAVADAEEALRSISRPLEATRRLVALVQELGGDLGTAQEQRDDLLPLDLSFAVGAPVLPRAEPCSLARLRLEEHLPRLVEVARRALAAL